MTRSKNPSGSVQRDRRAKSSHTEKCSNDDPALPVFFYLPQAIPHGVFCQWKNSWFTVPKSSLAYLYEDHGEQSTNIPLRSSTVAESSDGGWTTVSSSTNQKKKGKEETITFNCAEQYMMYCKALYFSDSISASKILASCDPKTQKALGRLVKGFDDTTWAQIRSKVAEEGNYAKFTQDERLKGILMETGERVLCEAARLDSIWGIGMDEVAGREMWRQLGGEKAQGCWGMNLLGKALVAVRKRIREEESRAREGQ